MPKPQKGPGELTMRLPKDAGGASPQSADYTSLISASALLVAEPCVLHGLLIETGGTNDALVELFDGTADTDDPIAPAITIAGADLFGGVVGLNVRVSTSVYAKITSVGGAKVQGYYNS